MTPVATLPSMISAIPLVTSGALSTGNNFAEIPNNSGIGGRVWLDLDNDGVIDLQEMANVIETLESLDSSTSCSSSNKSKSGLWTIIEAVS